MKSACRRGAAGQRPELQDAFLAALRLQDVQMRGLVFLVLGARMEEVGQQVERALDLQEAARLQHPPARHAHAVLAAEAGQGPDLVRPAALQLRDDLGECHGFIRRG